MPKKPAASSRARPIEYTPELGERICELLMCGGKDERPLSLRAICGRSDMPHVATVCRWLARGDKGEEPFKDFLALYEAARSVQAELDGDENVEIADTVGLTQEEIAKAKLRIGTRQWNQEKLRPKKYGGKVALTGGGDDDPPIKTELAIRFV